VIALAALALMPLVTADCDRAPPDAPVAIVWDREACAHCRMAIGEPRYAAQLVTTDAQVASFDDVGCLFRYLDERKPTVHRLWFHGEGDAWVAAAEVAFADGHTTPMGSGLAAVPASTPGAHPLEAVRYLHRAEAGHGHHHPRR